MSEIRKITVGFVIQRWDSKKGKFLGQEFIAGDQVDWEDENGESTDARIDQYEPFDMVQPVHLGFMEN